MFYNKHRRPSGRVRPLAVALGLLPMLLVSVLGNGHHDRPILLTNRSGTAVAVSGGWHHTLAYNDRDQCFPSPGVPSVGSYGLIVRRPPEFVCPATGQGDQEEDGLLFCFAGQMALMQRGPSMLKADPKYQISNRRNNKVAKACQKKRQQFCKENAGKCEPGGIGFSTWHGIRLWTVVTDGTVLLYLQLSYGNYKLPLDEDQESFWLKLGTQESLETVMAYPPFMPEEASGMMGEKSYAREVHFDEEDMEYYFANVHRGASLYKYKGLWTLAVDMLPTEEQRELHLFVYRGCQCTLQAWFTRPIDNSFEPSEAKLSAGTEICNTTTWLYNMTTHLTGFREGMTARFHVHTYNEDATINITLLDENNHVLLLNVLAYQLGKGSERIGKLEFGGPGTWKVPVVTIMNLPEEEEKRKREGKGLEVRIVHYGPVFEFQVGDMPGNEFWPDQWQTKPATSNASLQILGNQTVGGLVDVVPNREPMEMLPPRSLKMETSVANGTKIRIRAKVNEKAKGFKIRLLHDAPEFNKYIGATVMLMNVNLESGNITWSEYNNRQIFVKKNQSIDGNFMAGQSFEYFMTISTHDGTDEEKTGMNQEGQTQKPQKKLIKIDVEVNGKELGVFKGDLPIWTLNWIQIQGDIQLYERPDIYYANETSDLFKYELEHLLYDTDLLCIVGNFMQPENFRLYLFHEANEPNDKIGDTAMQITYEIDEKKQKNLVIRSFLHEDKTEEMESYPSSIKKGQDMTVRIRVADKGFYVSFFGADEELPFKDSRIPPWAANWLTVQGAVNVALSDKCPNAGQKALPGNMLQLYNPRPDPKTINNLLRVNDKIVLTGVVENATQVEVHLFREALEFNKIIGQTVLRVQFNALTGKITYNSYMAKNWTFPEEGNVTNSRALAPPLDIGAKFELKITPAGRQAFNLSYGNTEMHYENAPMPIWAVHYIVVNGLKVPAPGEANLVRIEKAKL